MTQVSLAADTAAICAAINAQFSASDPAVPPKDAAKQTVSHAVPWVSRTYNDSYLISGDSASDTGRVVVRLVCTSWDDLGVFRTKVRAALDERILPSGLSLCFETEGDTDTDEGWWVSDTAFTYVP